MASKKKARPLFEVPAGIDSGEESGWVYRSGGQISDPADGEAEPDTLSDVSAKAVALALGAMAQAMLLGISIATIPLALGLQALRAVAGRTAAAEGTVK